MKLLHPFDFFLETPTTTTVYACPACNEIISIEADTCRFCKVPIDRVAAQRFLIENQRVTNAVASANTFRFSIWLAVLTAIFGLWGVLANGRPESISFLGSLALIYGACWLYGYGSLDTLDPDYPVAVRRVKLTMVIWVVALFLPLVVHLVIRAGVR
jgi:hypothetical protein